MLSVWVSDQAERRSLPWVGSVDFGGDFGIGRLRGEAALWSTAHDLHQCDAIPDAPRSRMTTAEYQRDRASRLCDLARRASDPEHRRYLLGRAAEAARHAETLEREAVAKPDKAASDPKAAG